MNTDTIAQINEVIDEYFNTHKEDCIAIKVIMPALIDAGVFAKDIKKGLPFRKVLRALDEENALDKIPFVHPERKEKNTYWYLVRKGVKYTSKMDAPTISKKQFGLSKRVNSDENYILNLCDELLNDTSSRQHRFPFLLGDFHKDKKSRTKLPVDGYYHDLNLVIEYREKQPTEETPKLDKLAVKTISGVSREEQRKKYEKRRREVLLRKKFNLIEINYYAFEYDDDMKIIRNKEKDIEIVKVLLKDYIQ